MAYHLRRRDASHAARRGQRLARRQAIQEPRGELVARAGRVDGHHAADRHHGLLVVAQDDDVIARPGAHHQARVRRRLLQRRRQVGLIQRGPFVFVPDHVIQRLDQPAKVGAVAVNAERVA